MSYPDMKDYITFFLNATKILRSLSVQIAKPKGRPKVHPDCLLVIFFAIMILKGIHQKHSTLFLLSRLGEKTQVQKYSGSHNPIPDTNNSQPESSSSSNI